MAYTGFWMLPAAACQLGQHIHAQRNRAFGLDEDWMDIPASERDAYIQQALEILDGHRPQCEPAPSNLRDFAASMARQTWGSR